MADSGGARYIYALMNGSDPGGTGIGRDDAGRAQYGKAAENTEPAVHRVSGNRFAVIHRDGDFHIARRAVPELAEGKTFMMGSGATTATVARRMAFEMRNITVIAHSFAVATALAQNPTIRILMVPGEYHAGEGAMHGAQAIRFLQDYSADWVILGASALSPDGPSDALIEAGDVYATMLRQSSQNLVVADHSKFDRMATARYARWSDIDTIISDKAPEGPLAKVLDRNEVRLLVS